MRNFTDTQIEQAKADASSYGEFKQNLEDMNLKVPENVRSFPLGMKNWVRKLRYEIKEDTSFGTPTTGHDTRQARYYERLEELGCPEPLVHMG